MHVVLTESMHNVHYKLMLHADFLVDRKVLIATVQYDNYGSFCDQNGLAGKVRCLASFSKPSKISAVILA